MERGEGGGEGRGERGEKWLKSKWEVEGEEVKECA